MMQCGKSGKCFLDKKAVEAIESIIKSGNDAEIRKRGEKYVVLEVKKKIKYSA